MFNGEYEAITLKQFGDSIEGKYVTLVNENKYDRNKRLISEIILSNGINENK